MVPPARPSGSHSQPPSPPRAPPRRAAAPAQAPPLPKGVSSRGNGEDKQEPRLSVGGDLSGAERARRTPVLLPSSLPQPRVAEQADPVQAQQPGATASGTAAAEGEGGLPAPPPEPPTAQRVVSPSACLRGGAGGVSTPIHQLPSGARVQKEWERWVTDAPLSGDPTGVVSQGHCQHRKQHPCTTHPHVSGRVSRSWTNLPEAASTDSYSLSRVPTKWKSLPFG